MQDYGQPNEPFQGSSYQDPYAPIPPEPPAPEPSAPEAPPGPPDSDARMWGMFCHLAAFAGFIGVPFGNLVGPLVVWLIKKEQIPFVDYHGKEALNFQISMTIYSLACLPLICLGPLIFLAIIPLAIISIVFAIVAAVRANAGEMYEYPITIRFVK